MRKEAWDMTKERREGSREMARERARGCQLFDAAKGAPCFSRRSERRALAFGSMPISSVSNSQRIDSNSSAGASTTWRSAAKHGSVAHAFRLSMSSRVVGKHECGVRVALDG
jgi:hypothetical protein